VIDGETGIFFSQQSPESLSEAIVRFEDMALDQQKIRTHAEQFSKERFQEKMENFIQQL
jgi:type II secretory pathway component HofQ